MDTLEAQQSAVPSTTEPMTEREARACVGLIQSHIKSARAQILELYQRDGWRALGYDSWSQCVVAEFKGCRQHLWRQLKAAQVELLICPYGEVGQINESKLRPLFNSELEDEEKVEVWNQASVNGFIDPSTKRVQELANKALAGMAPEDKKLIIEESEDKIIKRAARKRRKETAKSLLDWLEKWLGRSLRKINQSGLNLKPLPVHIAKMQTAIQKLRVRLFGRKRVKPSVLS